MPGKVKVRIVAGRSLPVMDRSNDTTDAFVEVRLGNTTYKTDVYRKSLNPQWNSEWFRFEVDDSELQDEPLQIRIMDHDTYSANDAIGKVYVDLNPLVMQETPGGGSLSGWLPVFDTMHGIRGEISLVVKVESFTDVNRSRQSSCGVRFFHAGEIPENFEAVSLQGFVEELVANDDPEYQWLDKIRTPRASNEARQTLFSKLSGEVQRRIGLKALDLGGNAVIGYRVMFDLEGESGIVVRGIGTAATLTPLHGDISQRHSPSPSLSRVEFWVGESGASSSSLNGETERLATSLPHSPLLHADVIPFASRPQIPVLTRRKRYPAYKLYRANSAPRAKTSARDKFELKKISFPGGFPFLSSPRRSPLPSRAASDSHFVDVGHYDSEEKLEVTRKPRASRRHSKEKLKVKSKSARFAVNTSNLKPKIKSGSRSARPIMSPIPEPDFEFVVDARKVGKARRQEEDGWSGKSEERNPDIPPLFIISSSDDSCSSCDEQDSGVSSVAWLNVATSPASVSTESTPCHSVASIPTNTSSCSLLCSPTRHDGEPPGSPRTPGDPSDPELCSAASKGSKQHGSLSHQDSFEMLEFPFLTMVQFPPGFIQHIGGVVSARSVKLLDRITSGGEECDTRESWWSELRAEIRGHCRAVACNVVLAYRENTTFSDEVCILSASGTAALIASQRDLRVDYDGYQVGGRTSQDLACGPCHIAYNESSLPFAETLNKCHLCRKGRVPDLLMSTSEIPSGLSVAGRGSLIQAGVWRTRKEGGGKGELAAKELSDSLPFLEFEIHKQLVSKLRIRGMNAIFGLKVDVTLGEKLVVGMASGTAVFLKSLPVPPLPRIVTSDRPDSEEKVSEVQRLLVDHVNKNKEFFNIVHPHNKQDGEKVETGSDTEDSEEELSDLDLSCGNKETCVLELDDTEDMDVFNILSDSKPPDGFDVSTLGNVPGVASLESSCQTFTRVWRCKTITTAHSTSSRSVRKQLDRLMHGVYFKFRKLTPCQLCALDFKLDVPESDEIQISVVGLAVGVGKMYPPELEQAAPNITAGEDANSDDCAPLKRTNTSGSMLRRPPTRVLLLTTPHVPGYAVQRYLGNLNFFFIRESSSIREYGGLSGFMQSLVTEVMALVRAHAAALGGNALTAYFMSACVLMHNPHKNQAQCLINVGGDVVQAVVS